jgi:glycosyltransferase involved in cell wall biosynthesis
MKVGINAIFWTQERTGSGQYTRYLWDELRRQDAVELEAGYDQLKLLSYAASDFGGALDSTLTAIAEPPSWLKPAGKNIQKVWWEQRGVATLLKQAAAAKAPFDVLHYPYFAAPLLPIPAPTKLVVTVHDLIPLALPEYAPSSALKLYFRLVTAATRRADLILADSEFTKTDILRYLKVPTERVHVVYLGIDKAKYQAQALGSAERLELLRRLGLEGNERLIFYIGGFDLRKNVPLLIQAFAQALPRLRELEQADGLGAWTLVLAGKPHTANTQMYPDVQHLAGIINQAERGRVRFLGAVSESDKASLYRAADFFVFPSRYEGFGLDPLEALASGTPVVCSNASSLPEVVGEAARLVDPASLEAWSTALVELASDAALRNTLRQQAAVQVAKFDWSKTATRTLELYNMLECFNSRGKAR